MTTGRRQAAPRTSKSAERPRRARPAAETEAAIVAAPVEQAVVAGVDPAADLALLRRFEPVVHYTHGELFFPAPS